MPALEPTPQPHSVPARLNSSRVVAEMTPAEYHAFLRTANDKYQYIDGKVIQIPGASPGHNYIQIDFIRTLGNLLEEAEGTCDVIGSDQKIYVSPSRHYLADAVVVCGAGQFDFEDCLRNLALIAEVLSPSTAFFDQEDKFVITVR